MSQNRTGTLFTTGRKQRWPRLSQGFSSHHHLGNGSHHRGRRVTRRLDMRSMRSIGPDTGWEWYAAQEVRVGVLVHPRSLRGSDHEVGLGIQRRRGLSRRQMG